MALVRDGLWGNINGAETAPAADAGVDIQEKFQARKDQALATVVLAIEPSLCRQYHC